MKKRPLVAVLNAIEASGNQVISSSTEWGIVKTAAGNELLLGMFRTGQLVRTESFDPVAEVRQIVVIDAVATPETIVASTRYRVEIGNPDDKYETHRRHPFVHAYTTAANLSGTASTDRANVYTALATKINGYATNNASAYPLTVADFTLGTSTGDTFANFIVGESVAQETSTETARIARCTITAGTMAGDDAAGKIWIFDRSADAPTWLITAKTLSAGGGTGESNCVVTVTNATTVFDQGLAIEDAAGYFISTMGRPGANWVGATQGWLTAVAETALAPVYSMGIGSVMAQLVPRYDHSKQDVVAGFLEYELQDGAAFDIAKTYRTYVFTIADGDEDAIVGEKQAAERQATLYVDFADGDLADFNTAIGNLT